ncbi:hypothetical protein ACWKSP_01555 [Micromonosporaceae bacterium Da 78-11]
MYGARSKVRRWQVVAVAGVAVTLVGVGLGVASAAETAAPTVSCPGVAGALPAVPVQAKAKAEVDRNLALLDTQIAEADKRLASTVGQGGKNFIQNAILGPLKDKRVSTIDRIAISIGRHTAKPALDVPGLATCSLNTGGGAPAAEPATAPVTTAPAPAATAPAAGDVAVGTVNCPALMNLPAIPAQAQAEVARNLALLDAQIAEANRRLVDTVGQGGPAFIQNAILGPLADKRFATINRIATAIGRNAAKSDLNAAGLAPCALNS